MRSLCICLAFCLTVSVTHAQETPGSWKAGVATRVITPQKNVWMAGYASRKEPAAGKAQDLFAKALAFEDPRGERLVIVTLDLIGVTRAMRDEVGRQVEKKYKLPNDRLLLNASHTHSGPLVRPRPSVTYDLSEEQWKEAETYMADLQITLVQVVGAAIEKLEPCQLGYTHARAGFAMNRRLPTEKGYQNSPYPDGPVDHEVPVLRVTDGKGKLRAVLFGYACHNTTLALQQFSGDYAGYAQEYLQDAHPGATALFLMGCGGDQNPYPRGTIDLAKQHGRTLATAVEAALLPKPRPISGNLSVALDDVTLQLVPLSRDDLVRMSMSKDGYDRRRSKLLLPELEKTGTLKSTYQYPVQVVQFGRDLTLIPLAGEVVVDYSLTLKKDIVGNPVWVAGYSNDVFGYVPSLRVLKEGGYEGGGAMRYSTMVGTFAPSVEERILGKVHQLTGRVRKERSEK
ncbi:MAG TPA: neutral/alkaline non-lysosomal ceramidase N-terminal domain-containing protein [Gemmataceae bacterium]|nr:neutral/alkaline non-lysosomal ceramidase N-terminal domain-containing protein [Gemmataceae bacterium]